jgi:hypothetical protein
MGTVPTTVPKNRSVCSRSCRRAAKSRCISGGGGWSAANWQVSSYIGRVAALRRCS